MAGKGHPYNPSCGTFVHSEESLTRVEIGADAKGILPYQGMESLVVFNVSSGSFGPIDGACSANQEKGGEKLPGVLEYELFRRHQVLPSEPRYRIFDPYRGVFGLERRSLKES